MTEPYGFVPRAAGPWTPVPYDLVPRAAGPWTSVPYASRVWLLKQSPTFRTWGYRFQVGLPNTSGSLNQPTFVIVKTISSTLPAPNETLISTRLSPLVIGIVAPKSVRVNFIWSASTTIQPGNWVE